MKFAIIIITMVFSFESNKDIQIRNFVENELACYPEAQLADLYKNYFQDAYGSGHLIPDTTRAGKYLDWELRQPNWTDTTQFQPLGVEHNFYRINLSLIKEGVIPRDTLLLAMVKSAKLSRNPSIENWKKEWNNVLEVIINMNLNLPFFEEDRLKIEKQLKAGNVVMHHSEHYEKMYHPHYRIIHQSIFKSWQKKYFKSK